MTTSDEIKKNISENSGKANAKDYKFYEIEFINRLAEATEQTACDCETCKGNMEHLRELSATYPELLSGGYDGKKALEDKMDAVTKHLTKEHGYSRKGWYKPLYILIGLAGGLALSTLLATLIISNPSYKSPVFCCVTIGLMFLGNILGDRKDLQQAKKGKIL